MSFLPEDFSCPQPAWAPAFMPRGGKCAKPPFPRYRGQIPFTMLVSLLQACLLASFGPLRDGFSMPEAGVFRAVQTIDPLPCDAPDRHWYCESPCQPGDAGQGPATRDEFLQTSGSQP